MPPGEKCWFPRKTGLRLPCASWCHHRVWNQDQQCGSSVPPILKSLSTFLAQERTALHGIDGGPAESAQGQEPGDRASEQACLTSPFCPACKLGKRDSIPVSYRLLLSVSLGLYHIHTAHWEYLKSHPGPPLCSGNLLSVHAHTHVLVTGPAIKILADSHFKKSSPHTAASLGTLGGGSTGRASKTRCA